MSDLKVKIYTPVGQYVGYFLNPTLVKFPENEYEIFGTFYDDAGEQIGKLEFNPESLPYNADLSELSDIPHASMINVYIQRGRQPVRMSGLGTKA